MSLEITLSASYVICILMSVLVDPMLYKILEYRIL
jgi:hypothetical protein